MKNSYKDNFNFNMSPSEQEAAMFRQNKEYAMSQKSDDEPKKPITADANQLSDELYSVIDSLINDQSLQITNKLRRRLSDELEIAFDSIALTLDTLEGDKDE